MPTGRRSATPITTARFPFRSAPVPHRRPPSFRTSWPLGNNDDRISASVMMRPPHLLSERDEPIGGHRRHGLGVADALYLPDFDRIATRSESLQAILEPRLLGSQVVEAEATGRRQQRQGCVAKVLHEIVREQVGAAEQGPVFPSHRSPDSRVILGIELLDA